MPWTEREEGESPIHGPTVWRALIILTLILAGFGLYLSARLFTKNRGAIESNKELACSIGAFLVDAPVIKQPEITQRQFEEQVRKARDFLVQLRERDCAGLSAVTTAAINRQIRKLKEAAPHAFKGGGDSTASNPSSPAGGGPQGGGPSPSPEPSSTPTPVVPPTTTSTTSTGPIRDLVCHLNPLGIRICRDR